MKRVIFAAALFAAAAAATPVQAQTSGRAATTYQQRIEQQLISLGEEWARAARAADARALERLLADDFSATTADGEVKGRREYIADLVSGTRKVSALAAENYQARVHGGAAVLSHGGTLRGEYRGRDVSGRYRWTHFYVQRGRRWRCVAIQATRVAQQR